MTLTGTQVGTGVAHSPVPFIIIEPDRSPANVAAIAAEVQRWKATAEQYRQLSLAGTLDPQVAKRAQFCEEVLFSVAETNIRLGACCCLVAQSAEGTILGVLTYGFLGQNEGAINLTAVDPEYLNGAPARRQLRSIGTSLVAAVSRRFLSRGIEAVYLHAFDAEAARWWGNRGFGPCGRGGLLCLRGTAAIEALKGHCEVSEDGGSVICGHPRQTESVRIPSLRTRA